MTRYPLTTEVTGSEGNVVNGKGTIWNKACIITSKVLARHLNCLATMQCHEEGVFLYRNTWATIGKTGESHWLRYY